MKRVWWDWYPGLIAASAQAPNLPSFSRATGLREDTEGDREMPEQPESHTAATAALWPTVPCSPRAEHCSSNQEHLGPVTVGLSHSGPVSTSVNKEAVLGVRPVKPGSRLP